MISQKSNGHETRYGKLYLVGTPIGNLEDMTFRAIRILEEVDVIAAEDTRNTIKLCNHFEITTPLMSYHEHNQVKGGEKLLSLLEDGQSVALVSDAGMPCISDPGVDIAQKAIQFGIDVVPIPGANAAITALVASGLSTQPFLFYGFLSRNKKQRNTELTMLGQKEETLIFYEAPHRLKETLKAMQDKIDGSRKVVLAREVTKKFEEFLRGTLAEAIEWAESNQIRGEFCVILEGNDSIIEDIQPWKAWSVVEHVTYLIEEQGMRSKEAIKEVSIQRSLPKREVYQAYHIDSTK